VGRSVFVVTVVMVVLASGCSSSDEPVPTSAPTTAVAAPVTPAPTTVAPPTSAGPEPTTLPPVATTAPPATTQPPATTEPPAGPPVFAVGPGEIEYRGGASELERTGPRLLTVDPGGGFHIYDPVGGRIITSRSGARSEIDVFSLDILNVEAMAATSDHLILAEIFFAPVRHRIHRLGYDGTLLDTFDLPEGLRLEDGLSGLLTGTAGEIVIELEGGVAYGVWDDQARAFTTVQTLSLGGTEVSALDEAISINGVEVTADLSGFGGMRYLGTAADGTVLVQRDDVIAADPGFVVLTTVEWYSMDGGFLGSARVPTLEEQHTDEPPGLAVARDGSAYALVTRPQEVAVIELDREARRIVTFDEPM
jgi:hypothetical protein